MLRKIKNMMLRLLAALLVLGLTTSAVQGWNSDMPPPEFQGEAQGTVFFLSPSDVNNLCGKAVSAPADIYVYACAVKRGENAGVIVLPDPCVYANSSTDENYAQLVCHETAHLRGWEHE